MKKLIWACLATAALTTGAHAMSAANSKAEFCASKRTKDYAQQMLNNEENILSFTNYGGLINGGVCWWHSRFTRNATYLAIYRPELAAPSLAQAKAIIKKIRSGNAVVDIPGFANLYDFSISYHREIQDELERWQRNDGFVRQQWIVGLAGRSETTASDLKNKMDDLYKYVAVEGNVAYQKLQLPGVVAHAWLVTGMEKTSDGYEMTILDSNYSRPYTVSYYEGMTHFNYGGFGNFVPYVERERELNSLKSVANRACR